MIGCQKSAMIICLKETHIIQQQKLLICFCLWLSDTVLYVCLLDCVDSVVSCHAPEPDHSPPNRVADLPRPSCSLGRHGWPRRKDDEVREALAPTPVTRIDGVIPDHAPEPVHLLQLL